MKRVLVVDDASFMRETLKLMLERNGFIVVGDAENGEVALKKYNEYSPDIVTLDITMPVMDGLECLKRLLEIDPKANVVMISAMGQMPMVKSAILTGAKNFIVKPFEERSIIEVLNKI